MVKFSNYKVTYEDRSRSGGVFGNLLRGFSESLAVQTGYCSGFNTCGGFSGNLFQMSGYQPFSSQLGDVYGDAAATFAEIGLNQVLCGSETRSANRETAENLKQSIKSYEKNLEILNGYNKTSVITEDLKKLLPAETKAVEDAQKAVANAKSTPTPAQPASSPTGSTETQTQTQTPTTGAANPAPDSGNAIGKAEADLKQAKEALGKAIAKKISEYESAQKEAEKKLAALDIGKCKDPERYNDITGQEITDDNYDNHVEAFKYLYKKWKSEPDGKKAEYKSQADALYKKLESFTSREIPNSVKSRYAKMNNDNTDLAVKDKQQTSQS